ncbi:protocadherin alpha-5-like [Antennarius striatus]|uniref:protocadherin alpha-5-like n=1 Tax=Antennarius striatus TaxID=241820 RepID=UPI0035ADB0F0
MGRRKLLFSLWINLIALLFLNDGSLAQLSFSVSEEADKGTVAGNLAKELRINVRDLEKRDLRVVSGNSKIYFDVDLKTGALYVCDRIDREELCPNSEKCSLNIEAILSHPTHLHRIEVEIIDVNDNAPSFREKENVFNISESSIPGERYLLPMANDADTGSNSVNSYRLNANEYFSLDVQQSESAELVLQKSLDREKQSVIHLTLTALDGGKPPRSGTLVIVVNVMDTNDNAPVFSQSLYKARVTENAPFQTSILSVSATDLDEGVNSEIVYSFIERGNFNPESVFSINSNTGEIYVTGEVDYEKNTAYDIRIQARDNGIHSKSVYGKVLVEVIDLNDNRPEIIITSLMSPVKEDAEIGTVVALVTVTDRDGGKNGLTNANIIGSVPFKLKLNYKNYYSLTVGGPLDREKYFHYNVTIMATDEGSPPLSSMRVISVHISDVNDNVPIFSEPIINVNVKENSAVGTTLCTITAVDPDVEENAKVTYSLLNVISKGIPIASISINSETGDIISLQSFNYEEMKTFQFKVQATDSGVPPLSSNVTVNVLVLDENDNSPAILPPYSEHGSVNSESIPYSAEAGYFVAKIRAVDADSGYNALLSYHLSEPKGNNLFRIGTSTGEIRTKRRMSDNDLKSHPLVVLVCDNGEPSLSATVSIEVVVVENTADIQTQFRHVPIKEESFSDLNLYLLIAIVSVSVIFLLSLITLMAVKCHRTDGTFSRYSAPMITTHPDGSWSYSKSTQQYDVCFSSDTLKSDVVVFPAPFPPADGDLISINGGDTFTRTQTLPSTDKVRVEAIVKSPLNLYRFEVKILDINDNAPSFRIPRIVLNASESAFIGERFALPKAFDADVGNYAVKGYKLSQNEHFTLDVQNGGEPTMSAEMVLHKNLDREKQSVIKLTLTAVDGGKPPKSGTLHITVNVQDVNDNIPIFDKPLYKAVLPENTPNGTAVVSVRARDLDEGLNGEIFYSFINQDNDNFVDIFAINPTTGEITVNGEVDHEKSNAVEIRVQAKDKGSSPRASHCKVLVEITDVNDNSPEIAVTSLVDFVREDAPLDTMVGLITVRDNDADKNGAVQVTIVNPVPFKIKNTYKNHFSLVVDGTLDREVASYYNVTITAIDEGDPPLSGTSVITVQVSDVNDNAPRFKDPVINVFVKENSPVGAVIYTITADDPDDDENAKVTFSVINTNPKNNLIGSVVNINSETGDIISLQSFNYEEMKTFQFKVQATDSGVPPLSSNVTVNVLVLDENDNSPAILPPYSEHGSVNSESIPYSAEAGYFVAKIRAVDADSGYNALLSYHLSEPKGNNLFRIGTSTGEIRTKRRMSDNDLKSHPLVVLVCDNGEPSLSATVSIEVVVVENTADIQTQFRHVPIKEESFSDLNLYLLIAIVSVSVIFLLSLITLMAVKCHRTDGTFSRYSAPMITTHPDGSWSYSKSTQQYDVCFSSDTLKSDVVVFPAPFPPADGDLISINGGDTFTRTQTLPSTDKASCLAV